MGLCLLLHLRTVRSGTGYTIAVEVVPVDKAWLAAAGTKVPLRSFAAQQVSARSRGRGVGAAGSGTEVVPAASHV